MPLRRQDGAKRKVQLWTGPWAAQQQQWGGGVWAQTADVAGAGGSASRGLCSLSAGVTSSRLVLLADADLMGFTGWRTTI